MDDMIRDGRSCAGSSNGNAVLFSKDVVEVLRMVSEGLPHAKIARKFGVSPTVIQDIAHGKTYTDIPGPRTEVSKPTNRFYGVAPNNNKKWIARIQLGRERKYLGQFRFEVDAAICVNAHIAYLGLDLPLNIIPEGEWCHG
jgi:hypothetical protein